MSESNLLAETNSGEDKSEDWRVGLIQKRFAKLIDTMGSELSPETKKKLLEQMGRTCSLEAMDKRMQFKGNVEGFLDELRNSWVEKTTFDKEKGVISIVGKKYDICFCPFVSKDMKSKDFCNCSAGWQKETFETLTGKKVDVSIDTSIIRESDHCSFTVKLS